MNTVSKGVLKAKMLEYFRQVEQTGEELIVTDHHKPVLKVIPIKEKKSAHEVFMDIRGKLKVKGDLTASTVDEWPQLNA